MEIYVFVAFTANVARLLKFYGIPLLTAGGFAFDYNKPKKDPLSNYYLLTKTGYSYKYMSYAIYDFFLL